MPVIIGYVTNKAQPQASNFKATCTCSCTALADSMITICSSPLRLEWVSPSQSESSHRDEQVVGLVPHVLDAMWRLSSNDSVVQGSARLLFLLLANLGEQVRTTRMPVTPVGQMT